MEESRRKDRYLLAGFMFSLYLFFVFQSYPFLILPAFFISLVGYFMITPKYSLKIRLRKTAWWTLGLFYCGVLPGIIMLGLQKFGTFRFFLPLLLISFLSDTFAYLGGKLFGRKPLAPMISPQKTLEGSLVGLVAGTMTGCIYFGFLNPKNPFPIVVLISFLACFFGQVGDLFESMMKRHYGIKDSGFIMPGHGGILDRVDSVLFAGPVIYIWMFFSQIEP